MSDEDQGLGDGYEVIATDSLVEADDDTEHRLGKAFPNPDLSLCPVIPLGFMKGLVVFAMPEGVIRMEAANKIAGMMKTDLFACQAGQAFLSHWRDTDDKFQRDVAAIWFVRKCRELDLWNDRREVRGLGVWPGPAGAVVLHRGTEIWTVPVDGKPSRTSIADALRTPKGPIYERRPAAPEPKKPAGVAEGRWIREHLDSWRFEAIGHDGLTGADILAGWLMPALLGAVAPFRGHLMMHALAGAGKTTLMAYIAALMSGFDIDVIDSFTFAGLRGELSGQARPVLIDEAESSPGGQHGPGPVELALTLLRSMATGSGGTRKQGDIGGGSVTQTAVGAVLMAATTPPKLGPADASRIVEYRLLPLVTDPPRPLASDADLEVARARAEGLGPALLGRALSGAKRYVSDVAEMKAALGRVRESPRTADLIAMLAAGRRLLLFDDALTPAEADQEALFWKPLLVQRETFDLVANPGAECLAHLFNVDSGQHVRDRRQTLGELISRWVKKEREYDDTLKAFGVRIEEALHDGGTVHPGPWLLVANNHPALEQVFSRSRWPDWRRTLTHLDALGPEYATRIGKPINFGLHKARHLAIPLTPWIEGSGRPFGTVPGSGVPPGVPEEDYDWS